MNQAKWRWQISQWRQKKERAKQQRCKVRGVVPIRCSTNERCSTSDQNNNAKDLIKRFTTHSWGIVNAVEKRFVEGGASFDLNIRTLEKTSSVPSVPMWWTHIPILILGLDPGPVGTAGMANHRPHVKFDKIIVAFEIKNWLWPDVWVVCFWKRSCIPATCGGWSTNLLEAVNFMSKRGPCWKMLEAFLEQEDISGALWQELRECIALDHGRDFLDDQVRMAQLDSFKNAGVWCLDQASSLVQPDSVLPWIFGSFHILKMLLQFHFGENLLPNDVSKETQLTKFGRHRASVEPKEVFPRRWIDFEGSGQNAKSFRPQKRTTGVEKAFWWIQACVQVDDRRCVWQLSPSFHCHKGIVDRYTKQLEETKHPQSTLP